MNHFRLDYNINWNHTKYEHGLLATNHIILVSMGTELLHLGRLTSDSVTDISMKLTFYDCI